MRILFLLKGELRFTEKFNFSLRHFSRSFFLESLLFLPVFILYLAEKADQSHEILIENFIQNVIQYTHFTANSLKVYGNIHFQFFLIFMFFSST